MIYSSNLTGRIRILEDRKNDALHSRDAESYFNSCNELGISPEDEILYQRGSDLIEVEKMRNLPALKLLDKLKFSDLKLSEPSWYVYTIVRDFERMDKLDLKDSFNEARKRLGLLEKQGFEITPVYRKGIMDDSDVLELYGKVTGHIYSFSEQLKKLEAD